jgi:hypothetical protein
MVRPAVALGTGACDRSGIRIDVAGSEIGGQHADPRQRMRRRVRSLDVLHPRPVAALALDVVIGGVLHHVPPRGLAHGVAVLAHRVAAVAEVLRGSTFHQAGIRIRVGRLLPLVLVVHVAVAAGGRLVAGGEVADEPGVLVRRRVERLAVDDLVVTTCDRQKGEEP